MTAGVKRMGGPGCLGAGGLLGPPEDQDAGSPAGVRPQQTRSSHGKLVMSSRLIIYFKSFCRLDN